MASQSDDAEFLHDLREFVKSSRVALTLADPDQDDCPLVAVNRAFCDVVGYEESEMLARNCRFLQPPGGAGPVRERLRSFLSDPAAGDARFVVANRRKDGAPFLNLLFMAKLRRRGHPGYVLGSQFDLTRHRLTEADYEAALREDLQKLSKLMGADRALMLSSIAALATSQRILAEARLEG